MSIWLKTQRFSEEPVRTKHSMTQRFRNKRHVYWDYIDSKGWKTNDLFRHVRKHFRNILRISVGKHISEINTKVKNIDMYKHNKFAHDQFNEWLKDLCKPEVARSYCSDTAYSLDTKGILRYRKETKGSFKGRKSIKDPCEFSVKGYPILYKNGVHYTKSFNYRVKKYHYECVGIDRTTKKAIYESYYTLEPVWHQLSSKYLKLLSLFNKPT